MPWGQRGRVAYELYRDNPRWKWAGIGRILNTTASSAAGSAKHYAKHNLLPWPLRGPNHQWRTSSTSTEAG